MQAALHCDSISTVCSILKPFLPKLEFCNKQNLGCIRQWSCHASAGGLCCLRRRGEWWTRLSLDLEHLGRPDESLEVSLLRCVAAGLNCCSETKSLPVVTLENALHKQSKEPDKSNAGVTA